MLFILMVFATLKIDLDRLIRAIKRPGLLITGICILYIVVPLAMYTLATADGPTGSCLGLFDTFPRFLGCGSVDSSGGGLACNPSLD